MYYCNDCGEYFEESDNSFRYETEYHGELGSEAEHFPELVKYLVCPHCGSEEWSHADECELCGKPFHAPSYYCPDCISAVGKAFAQFLEDTFFEIGQGDMSDGIEHIKTIVGEEFL